MEKAGFCPIKKCPDSREAHIIICPMLDPSNITPPSPTGVCPKLPQSGTLSAGSIFQQSLSSAVASAVRPYRDSVPIFIVFRLICPPAGSFIFNPSVQLIDPTTGISVCNGPALHTSQTYHPSQPVLSGPTDISVHHPNPVLPSPSFHRDTVRALRAIYVRDFDILEKRHDRHVQCNAPNYSPDDPDGEKQWIQDVIYDHQKAISYCDVYLSQTNSRPCSVVSRASSRHSSVSSRQAKIHEAERKEKEAELMLQQVEDETRRREEEDAKIREAEDYKRKVERERKQREIRDEIDLQRLSGAIIWKQLTDLTVNDQAVPTRASSLVSGLSRVSGTSSHPSLPNNSNLLAQTPAAFAQTSTMTTTAPITRIIATPQPQPSTVVISTAAQTLAMTVSRIYGQDSNTNETLQPTGSDDSVNAKVFTPSSLTRSASVPYIPLNAGASNASVTTSITNPTFSTPSSTSVAAQPVTTSQTTSTVYNIVTPPTSVPQVPVSIIPPTTTPVTAPISTSAVPQAPKTTVPPFAPPTSTSVAAPVSSSAAHPFTPVTTATIHVPTTSNVTHVPVSVPLPHRSSASVPFPPGSSASVPFPPVSSESASSWVSSWRNRSSPFLRDLRCPRLGEFKLEKHPFDLNSLVKQWPHLSRVPVCSTKRKNVAILIGQNHPAAIEIFEIRKHPSNHRAPRAYLTAFGWCIAGPSGQLNENPQNSNHSESRKMECDPVQQQSVEADPSSRKMNIIRPTVPKKRGASRGVSADDVQAGSTLNPQQIPPNLHRDVDDSRAGCQFYKTANLTELVPFSDHRVLQGVGGKIKKPPLPIGSR
ncbi:hypothetical protein DAPPUDRAFT_250108 [Daphnia pulex]|uniref:Uncharacterized protein n=1 Tax=Daphnia pulex TaxID=6669 RepID=E9GXX8_DAPPU|nr:hypothetical protein DAPPUDRAFT_250108 [Daphnia pulex]|eukprot:EFX75652.1 hypothetical protein DAPPUDRAFT_250108 [Daphnia pulex]